MLFWLLLALSSNVTANKRFTICKVNCDHALLFRYPLCIDRYTYIRECEPGQARRLALETRVLDGCANGGRRVRSMAGFRISTRVPAQKWLRKWPGKLFSEAAGALAFFGLAVLAPSTYPRRDGRPRQVEKPQHGERQRSWDWAYGMRRRDRRATARRVVFARLPPPISGNTEVSRELD
jgi:hypothetical protein